MIAPSIASTETGYAGLKPDETEQRKSPIRILVAAVGINWAGVSACLLEGKNSVYHEEVWEMTDSLAQRILM